MRDITAVDLGQALAEHCVEIVPEGRGYVGLLANPEHLARRALETLAEREPCPFHLGNGAAGECNCELKKYALATPAHTQPIEDPELIAAQQILDALAPLETADPAAVLRVLRWARERYDL